MTAEALKKILSEESITFTIEEIRELIDEELKKPIDEMDAEFIDSCLNALEVAGVI